MSNFRPTDRGTGFLVPPSMDDWLPARHLARFVVDVIDGLDLKATRYDKLARNFAATVILAAIIRWWV
jgi:hypothetical protein